MQQKSVFLEKLSPKVRVISSIAISIILMAILYSFLNANREIIPLCGWLCFSAIYVLLSWITIFKGSAIFVKQKASVEDGKIGFVVIMILVASLAALIAVAMLIWEIKKDKSVISPMLYLPIVVGAMMLSWIMVHTIFTFHYAHLFYMPHGKRGLQFPEEEHPDYLDFAYFSFGIGCTFQVADVSVSSKLIRKTVLLHSFISFIINTFVVALSINILSGVMQ